MKIALHYQSNPPFIASTHETAGIGGTENFITYAAEYLARAGHHVTVYNRIQTPAACHYEGGAWAEWRPLELFAPGEERDVLISFRFREVFENKAHPKTGLKAIMLADTESVGLGEAVKARKIDLVGYVSQWQRDKIQQEEGIPQTKGFLTSNGISMEKFDGERHEVERIPGKCIHMATPERGLSYLLDIWPSIESRIPWASLHLFSSFLGWGVSEADNEAMSKDIYARIDAMIAAGARIINHKHAGAVEIRRHLLSSELYLYPTRHFDETCCISALEAAAAGVPIIATDRGALGERVENLTTGYLIPDIYGHDKLFAARAMGALLNRDKWHVMSAESVNYARMYDYGYLIPKWEHALMSHLEACA